ncbi:hypothetical protein PPSIR1_30509 [Plesiocystis pacifica SIR-1]|uniref:Uncharacterized protein n=1 Tax=Plesiocystis pacifica SIR-1 TaxID=391625 RepID=A6GGQ0_9BACT|nr:hypothetical protein [Plesiocystis pacifica]EDM74950.1 hypothetical protein PPSIR1_30509 [Plesiocystis pacifica SIR-1]
MFTFKKTTRSLVASLLLGTALFACTAEESSTEPTVVELSLDEIDNLSDAELSELAALELEGLIDVQIEGEVEIEELPGDVLSQPIEPWDPWIPRIPEAATEYDPSLTEQSLGPAPWGPELAPTLHGEGEPLPNPAVELMTEIEANGLPLVTKPERPLPNPAVELMTEIEANGLPLVTKPERPLPNPAVELMTEIEANGLPLVTKDEA